jgi:hypothetical protein
MTRTLWRLGGCVAVGLVALAMLFWGLERTALVDAAVRLDGADEAIPTRVYVLIFAGLILLSVAVFLSLTVWGGFLKANPETRQVPVWILVVVMVVCGGAGLVGFAQHAAYVRSLDTVPMDVDQGYIAFQVVTAAAVLVSLVVVGVRWAPGYRPVLMRDRDRD